MYGVLLIRNLKSLKIDLRIKRTLLYIFAGLCLAFAFPPFNVYTLYFLGIALLIYFVHSSQNLKQVFFKSYFTFLTFELVTVSWISLSGLREGADKFMIIGGFFTMVIHSALLTLPLVLYYFTRKAFVKKIKSLTVFTLPFIWVTIEYLYALPEVSFPWLTAGNAFTTALNKIQFIEITGVYGISFWALIISSILFLLLQTAMSNRDTISSLFKKRKVYVLIIIAAILFFIPDFYSVLTRSNARFSNNFLEGKIKVSIVQPNVNPWKKWGAKQMDLVSDYVSLIEQSDSTYPKSNLIIFPETATPFYLLDNYYADKYDVIKSLIDSINTPLLIGTPDLFYYNDSIKAKTDSKENKSSGQKYDTFNSVVLINPGEEKISHQKYAKIKLVIASERMPYQERLLFLKDIIRWSVGISSFQIGWDTTIFHLKNGTKFNSAICYESIYPEFFSSFSKKGAEFSVIITNDGWWGKLFGTHQHNQFAVLRAIENRRWIARCANTGISCTIDAYGNLHNPTAINEKMILNDYVGTNSNITVYAQNPYLFPNTLLSITVIIFIVAIISKITTKQED